MEDTKRIEFIAPKHRESRCREEISYMTETKIALLDAFQSG
jgi:hypothetical protein